MSALARLHDHVGTLVHPSVRASPLDAADHETFVLTRLLLAFGALVLAPPCLVLGARPELWQAAALGWLTLPFAAAILVARTGDLATGEALSIVAWLGVALTLAAGSGSPAGLALLLVVAVEIAHGSAPARSARLAAPGAGAALGAALVLVFVAGGHDASHGTRFVDGVLAGSVGYGMLLVALAGRARALRARHAADEAGRLRLIADLGDDVLVFLDGSGTVVGGGAGAERQFAMTPRDLAGRGLFERVLVSDRPLFLKQVADAAAGEGVHEGTYRLRTGRTLPRDDGAFEQPVFAYVDMRARRCGRDDTGRRVALLLRDVTVRKLHEQATGEAEAAARRNDAGRDRFLATVSHELRTPLNAIIGFSEILSNDALAPVDAGKRRDYARVIHQSGQHLLEVVNTILDASKIESGSFDVAPEAFDLAALIDDCVGMVALAATQAGVALRQDVPASVGELVADRRACKQIVLNLLSNALKFTPAGGRVGVEARPDGNAILLTVADTGIGINPRDLPRLGDPFFQARDGIDRDRDGTGLGLSVVRGLVGLHHGSISIESAPGEGTRVSVRLPKDCRGPAGARPAATRIVIVPRTSQAGSSGEPAESPKVSRRA